MSMKEYEKALVDAEVMINAGCNYQGFGTLVYVFSHVDMRIMQCTESPNSKHPVMWGKYILLVSGRSLLR